MADRTRNRRGVDVFGLIIGLGVLGASGYALSDGRLLPPNLDPVWWLAGGAVLVGVLLLVNSLRARR